MPVKDCIINGIAGKKCGDRGKCYTGKQAFRKAAAQCTAIGEPVTRSQSVKRK